MSGAYSCTTRTTSSTVVNPASIFCHPSTRSGVIPAFAASALNCVRDAPLAIENLYNVGDGVREYASGGVQACAETAKLVAERVLAASRVS